MTGQPLLEVTDLAVEIATGSSLVHAVRGASFSIGSGEVFGLVGESGCGKTTIARSIVRLLPPGGSIVGGSVEFAGQSLRGLSQRAMNDLRGSQIGFIFQNPSTSLNPVFTVGRQLAEPLRLHRKMSAKEARSEATDMLHRVGLPDPAERMRSYPHQLSGGMQQRVMIAIALACNPQLIIADEPTTALDVTIQAQILELIVELSSQTGAAVLLITHNLSVAASMCDRIAVMYAGQVVESGPVDDIFYRPQMPYSWGLLDALPQLGTERGARLNAIDGTPPDLALLAPGCEFAPRCRYRRDVCDTSHPLLRDRAGTGHVARCHATETTGWLQ